MKLFQALLLLMLAASIAGFKLSTQEHFRILVAKTLTQAEAREIKANFSLHYPETGLSAYYKEPYFYLETESCSTSAQADSILNYIEKRFPKAEIKSYDQHHTHKALLKCYH